MTAAPEKNHYIVVLKDSVAHPGSVAEAQTEQRNGELGFVYRSALKGYSAELTPGAAEALRHDPRVDFVTVDGLFEAHAQTIPTGIERISAPANAALSIEGTDNIRIDGDVAVIDTGVDLHPDLNVIARTDCSDDTHTPAICENETGADEIGHGTHVAGTIGALDNGFGVVGVAPGVRIWSVKVLGSGFNRESEIVAGIDWVNYFAGQIDVVNMSLGGSGGAPALDAAIAASVEKGLVYVVSAGNDGLNAARAQPAGHPDVVTVSALADYDGEPGGGAEPTCRDEGADDTLAGFSNWGSAVEVAAPGVCIYSTFPNGGYGSLSGTSMASPHVAGVAAVLANRSNPNSKKDVEAIRQALMDEGSLAWADTSKDARAEPLLHADDAPITATEVATGGVAGATWSPESQSATLNAAVNARGATTTYQFEYGPSSEYGKTMPASPGAIAAGTRYTTVKTTIGGLKADQKYHYRLVATNGSGKTYGPDRTFVLSRWAPQAPTSVPQKTGSESLDAVSCPTAGTCMSVGTYFNNKELPGSYRLSNGQWSFVAMPLPQGAGNVSIAGVSCSSANACTAVGEATVPGGPQLGPFVERWNGTSWSVQSIPPPPAPPHGDSPISGLKAVSCVSDTECVAVGTMRTYEPWALSPYAARWRGGTWTFLPTPKPPETEEASAETTTVLEDVSCTSATACTAVGYYKIGIFGPLEPVAMSWDGSSWVLHEPGRSSGSLAGVSCLSAADCLAVGAGTAVDRWDGSKWATEEIPGAPSGFLYDVSCASASECVATGRSHPPRHDALAAIWDGDSWRVDKTPLDTENADALRGVSCVPLVGCRAVGSAEAALQRALIVSRNPFTPDPSVDADVDGDTRADLIAVHSSGSVYANRGTSQRVSTESTSMGATVDPALYDGTGQYVVGSADVDGDRRSDLVTLADSGKVLVYRSEEDAGFGAPVDALEASQSTAPAMNRAGAFEPIAVTDVNRDGKADLVGYGVAAGESRVVVHMGRSSATFNPTPVVSLEGVLNSALFSSEGERDHLLDVADVDGDGYPDLVTLTFYDVLQVHPGTSSGYFRPSSINGPTLDPVMDDGSGQEPIDLGDVTGDGRADLLALSAGKLKLYAGKARETFGVRFAEPVGDAYPGTIDSNLVDGTGEDLVGLLDYNGDARADLVSSAGDGTIKSYAAQANGTFAAPVSAAAAMPSNRHHVNPGYQFASEQPLARRTGCQPTGCRWIARGVDGDVDGDRRADLTTLHTSGSAYVFAGNAATGFSTTTAGTSFAGAMDSALHDSTGSYAIDSADVTGDGRSDLVTIKASGGVYVYASQGDRTFGPAAVSLPSMKPAMVSGGTFEPIGVADVTADGRADLVGMQNLYGVNAHVVYPGQPDGTFGALQASQYAAVNSALKDGTGDYYLDVADVTGDGRADVVAESDAGALRVFRANAGGGFQAVTTTAEFALDPLMKDGQGHEPIGLADVNSDERADLVALNNSSGAVLLYTGKTDGTFAAAGSGGLSSTARSGVNSSLVDGRGHDLVGLLDYNGDGRGDLVTVTTNEEVRAYPALADGTFAAPLVHGPLSSNRFGVSPGHEPASEKPLWRRKPSVVPTAPHAPWSLQAVSPSSVELEDVACTSASSCIAVGADGDQAKALSWDGSAWSGLAVPSPSGASSSRLTAVTCISASSCTAAGSYVDAGVEKTLIMAWNGSSWSSVPSPNPSGAAESALAGISCSTASSCIAAGSYLDAGGTRKLLALRWGGSSWSLSDVSAVSGAVSSEYADVSCAPTASGGCAVVGSYVDGSGIRRPLVRNTIFGIWTMSSVPTPSGSTSAELAGVSCVSGSQCTAVGSHVDASGTRRSLVATREPSSGWALSQSPSPFGAGSTSLSAISCAAATACTAVGEVTVAGTKGAYLIGLEDEWWIQGAPVPAAASESRLSAVSCPTGTSCHVLGRARVSGAWGAFGLRR
ncbi:MAG TPA: S8 family serine peptidase [Solirubrobacterales bacterium]|nr:S8 family serine peptidase [Solirubrobacterales bacterium]